MLKGTLSAHDQDGTTLEKTFAGLYIIWIISQKQQQELCLICCIELNNNTLIFSINIFYVQFSFNKSVVILLSCVFLIMCH